VSNHFFGGRAGHYGVGLYLETFDEHPARAATGFVRLYSHTDGWFEKRGATVRKFALQEQANAFTLLNSFKDLELDDQDGTPIADRRLRCIDGEIKATDTSNVEGRYISRLSIELLEDSDLVESYIFSDGSRPFSGDVSLGGNLINDVADPAGPQDAATKNYVDDEIAAVMTSSYPQIVKSADESIDNSNVLQDDDELQFPMLANTTYHVRLIVFFAAGATPDLKYRVEGPTAPTLVLRDIRSKPPGGGTILGVAVISGFDGSDRVINGAAGHGCIIEEIIVQNGANAGDFKFRFAQNSATTSDPVTVYAGSSLGWKEAP
jgi:hypothetical protein